MVDRRVDSLELIVSQRFLTYYNLSLNENDLCLKFINKCPEVKKLTIGVKTNDLYERINTDVWSQRVLELIRKDILLKEQIKYSSEIQISLIQSPEYSANHDFSTLLKTYFNKSRYIVKNDVIGICSEDDPLYQTKLKSLSHNEWPVIYFRVNSLEGNGCLIDSNHSNLYQTGSTHSYIPATLGSYYRTNVMQFEDNPNPCGLESYIRSLSEIVAPYLMPNNTSIGTVMIEGPIGCGKKTIVRAMCKNWNLHLYHINTNDILGDSAVLTETKIKTSLSKAAFYTPTVVLISNINILSNNELNDDSRIAKIFSQTLFEMNDKNCEYPLVVIATNSEPKMFANNELNSLFIHSLEIDCLDIEERENIIRSLIGQIATSDVNFKELAQRSAAFYLSDLKALVLNAIKYAFDLLRDDSNGVIEESDLTLAGVVLCNDHLMKALIDLQKMHFESIGSPNIPNVKWEDIGGHETIKSEILDTIQLPLECPQLISLGFKRSGVLLYGPPGTGKTLLAKAAAAQCSLNFLSVKGPELINMFVGQSEENVRNIFIKARKCAPSVIFFDELDSLAPNRGHSGDSGGVMDRVVSQLLAEMDGINKSNEVFVIGATNRVDLLDSALLRPGRFDRLLYVGIADDSQSRLKILKALTRKFHFDSDVDLERIESLCPSGLSGADLYSICSNALTKAIERNIKQLNDKTITEDEINHIEVQMSDFMSVLDKTYGK
ncbi:unnamed protein product [Medioppia subpectinata]|uniref:Peroxisomal ATPase PEX6 n=1 Tax=Medioppia subpectinata TaxID=1979941 RepID=A0A7R9KS25_9ACAR|nr:unnamed protein product [Medioppia subpectinata]CAG2108767.1 unnamed protein product [Medioppia subpectinata]